MYRFIVLLIVSAFVALPVVAQNNSHLALVARAKAAVTKDFKDPDSAKFRNVGLYRAKTGKGGEIVCGEVNGRNSYGAYVGYRQFAVAISIVIIDRDDDPWSTTFGPNLCHELVARVE